MESTATALFAAGTWGLSSGTNIIGSATTAISALGAVVLAALAFKLAPKAIGWGLSKIRMGRG